MGQSPKQRRAMFARLRGWLQARRERKSKPYSFDEEINFARNLGTISDNTLKDFNAKAKGAKVRRYNTEYAKYSQKSFGASLSPEEQDKLTSMRRRAKFTLGLVGGKTSRKYWLYNNRADQGNKKLAELAKRYGV